MALAHLQRGNIAPVDLAQAAIGPGMAVFTRYAKVLDAEGKPLSVREALALINQTLDEALAEQEGDFDADSRWALAWFEQYGFAEGEYGVAENSHGQEHQRRRHGRGRHPGRQGRQGALAPARELPADWDPATDPRLTAWEVVHHLIRALERAASALPRRWSRSSAQGRERPRAGLPPLHPVRAQEARGGGAGLQRPGAELAGDHPPRPRSGERPATRSHRCSEDS